MSDTCSACGHSKLHNNHGPDQDDYEYDSVIERVTYRGSCMYCKICMPGGKWGLFVLDKMTGIEYCKLTKEEQNSLWIKYNEEKENKCH